MLSAESTTHVMVSGPCFTLQLKQLLCFWLRMLSCICKVAVKTGICGSRHTLLYGASACYGQAVPVCFTGKIVCTSPGLLTSAMSLMGTWQRSAAKTKFMVLWYRHVESVDKPTKKVASKLADHYQPSSFMG